MIPLLLGNLFQQFYNIVDAMIVGRLLGADAHALDSQSRAGTEGKRPFIENELHRSPVELYGANASWEDASLSDVHRRILAIPADPNSVLSMVQRMLRIGIYSTIAPESAECTSFAYFLR